MKRKFALLLAALFAVLTLTACGGGSGADSASASSGTYSGTEGGSSIAPMESPETWGFAEAEAQAEEDEAGESSRLASAKMVYTASVTAETTDFDACIASLEALVREAGGYVEYASASTYADGVRFGMYTLRVPSARFESFLKSVGDAAHITDQDRSADNISERYYDTESRLVTQQTKLERLQALLARAENMEDIITLESAIAETELQIEQLTGSLRHYDALVDYATVELRLQEVPRLTTVEETPPTFASRLGNAFVDGLHGFGDFLQALAIFLAYNWTWLVLLAVIALLVVRISRQRRARQAEFFGGGSPQGANFFHRTEKDEPKKPDDKQKKD